MLWFRIHGTCFKVIVQNEEQVELSFTRMWDPSLEGKFVPLNIDKRSLALILCISWLLLLIAIGLKFVDCQFQIYNAPRFIWLLLLRNLWALKWMARFWSRWNEDYFQAKKRQVNSIILTTKFEASLYVCHSLVLVNCICIFNTKFVEPFGGNW